MIKKIKKKEKSPKKIFSPLYIPGIIFIIALAGFLIFSAYSYRSSEQEKEGFFTSVKIVKYANYHNIYMHRSK